MALRVLPIGRCQFADEEPLIDREKLQSFLQYDCNPIPAQESRLDLAVLLLMSGQAWSIPRLAFRLPFNTCSLVSNPKNYS